MLATPPAESARSPKQPPQISIPLLLLPPPPPLLKVFDFFAELRAWVAAGTFAIYLGLLICVLRAPDYRRFFTQTKPVFFERKCPMALSALPPFGWLSLSGSCVFGSVNPSVLGLVFLSAIGILLPATLFHPPPRPPPLILHAERA